MSLASDLQGLASQVADLEADRKACRTALRQLALAVGLPGDASPEAVAAAVLVAIQGRGAPAITWRVEHLEGGLVLRRRTDDVRACLLLPSAASRPMPCEVCGENIPPKAGCWRSAGPPHGEQPLENRHLRVCSACVAALQKG